MHLSERECFATYMGHGDCRYKRGTISDKPGCLLTLLNFILKCNLKLSRGIKLDGRKFESIPSEHPPPPKAYSQLGKLRMEMAPAGIYLESRECPDRAPPRHREWTAGAPAAGPADVLLPQLGASSSDCNALLGPRGSMTYNTTEIVCLGNGSKQVLLVIHPKPRKASQTLPSFI